MIIIFLFLSGCFACVCVCVFVSICLFLNSLFRSGSMTLLWSNSTNWVFGISAIVTFSVRLAPRPTLAPCSCNFNLVKTSPTTKIGIIARPHSGWFWKREMMRGWKRSATGAAAVRRRQPKTAYCDWVKVNTTIFRGWIGPSEFSPCILHFSFHAKICLALKGYNYAFCECVAVTSVKILTRRRNS